jgi:N-methylhydantoinase A
MSEYSLGIDIGGTFTDLVIHDHDTGRRWASKVLTTHADPQQGCRRRRLYDPLGKRSARHRPRCAAQIRPLRYRHRNPAPLVPRNLRLDVSELMRADGSVAEPLDEAQVLRQVMCCAPPE